MSKQKTIEIMKTTKASVLAKKIEKMGNDKHISKNSLVYGWVRSITNDAPRGGKTGIRVDVTTKIN